MLYSLSTWWGITNLINKWAYFKEVENSLAGRVLRGISEASCPGNLWNTRGGGGLSPRGYKRHPGRLVKIQSGSNAQFILLQKFEFSIQIYEPNG